MAIANDSATAQSIPDNQCLGSLCKRKHRFQDSDYSLRYKCGGCVECIRSSCKKRRETNAEHMDAVSRAWVAKNRDKQLVNQRRFREKHREKLNADAREHRRKNLAAYAARLREYRKRKPDVMKRIEERRSRPASHKQIVAACGRRWKAKNKDKVLAAYHKRRARIDGGGASSRQIADKRTSQNGQCSYCPRMLDNSGRGHLEHQTPLSRGGSHDIDNIVFTCSWCNLSKGAKTLPEFIAYRRRLGAAAIVVVSWEMSDAQ